MKFTINKSKVKIDGDNIIVDIDNNIISDIVFNKKVKLSSLAEGEHFKIGNKEFIILKQYDIPNITYVISNEIIYNTTMKFGDNGDWAKSPIRAFLNNTYYKEIIQSIDAYLIKTISRDLISIDGLDTYGICDDKISLLTIDEYAKFHKILGIVPHYNYKWWTITPINILHQNSTDSIFCIDNSGGVEWGKCTNYRGIRPFFCLDSSAIVSIV